MWLLQYRLAARKHPIPRDADWRTLDFGFDCGEARLEQFPTRSLHGVHAPGDIPSAETLPAMLCWRLGFRGQDPLVLGLGAEFLERIDNADKCSAGAGRLGFIALVGSAGCGKTRAALEVLQRRYGLLLVCNVNGNYAQIDFDQMLGS